MKCPIIIKRGRAELVGGVVWVSNGDIKLGIPLQLLHPEAAERMIQCLQ